jgi:hypothetical protein
MRRSEGCSHAKFAQMKSTLSIALAGLDPAIHVYVLRRPRMKTWTPGVKPGGDENVAFQPDRMTLWERRGKQRCWMR